MKKYAISYMDFFNNDLKMELIETETEIEALKIAFEKLHEIEPVGKTTEDIKDEAFDCDSLVACIEVEK